MEMEHAPTKIGEVRMDILFLIDRLEKLITNSSRVPFTNQLLIKEGDLLTLLDQMRASIPDEVKQARRIVQEKDRILAQAQSEAAAITNHAREEAERMVSREGLLRTAEGRSQEMLQQARQQAQHMLRQVQEETENLKIEADSYVAETLHNLREHLGSIEMEVGRTIMSIEKGLESLKQQQYPSEEFGFEDEQAGEGGDVDGHVEERPDMDQIVYNDNDDDMPPKHSVPRRASLATDTTGGPTWERD
jgi:cell division septum initiation protein DivIVA